VEARVLIRVGRAGVAYAQGHSVGGPEGDQRTRRCQHEGNDNADDPQPHQEENRRHDHRDNDGKAGDQQGGAPLVGGDLLGQRRRLGSELDRDRTPGGVVGLEVLARMEAE
jgi:hypothetical protein